MRQPSEANKSKSNKSKHRASSLSTILMMVVILFIVLLSFCAWNRDRFHKSIPNQKERISSQEPKQRLHAIYNNELKNLEYPFAVFGINVQPIDIGCDIKGINKDDNGRISTVYDESHCQASQGGSIYLDSEVNRQQLAKAVVGIDALLEKNGWQTKEQPGSIKDRINNILRNQASLQQQVKETGVNPAVLTGSDFTKRIDAKTICHFTESEGFVGEEEGKAPSRLNISLYMSCVYDGKALSK